MRLIVFALSMLIMQVTPAAEITIYAIKSPVTINWSTPRSLLMSTLKNYAGGADHKIGHAYIGLRCDGEAEVLSGMTSGPGFTSRSNLFDKKHGLSIMLQDNPGHFETTAEVQADIDKLSKKKRLAVLRLEVNNASCLKAKEWYRQFSSRSAFIYGGLAKRPLRGEGAGCTAYVMSYLQYAQTDYAFFNNLFEQTIYIPEELLGGDYGAREVKVMSIYKNKKKLSIPAPSTLEVKLYDANTMYKWIHTKWDALNKRHSAQDIQHYAPEISKFNKSKVLTLRLN